MATPTTTEVAIAEALTPIIELLSPANYSDKPFQRIASDNASNPDFRAYAQDNAQKALRWFDLTMEDFEVEQFSNGDIVRRGVEIELVVAYPHVWGYYDAYTSNYTKRDQALSAMLKADITQILNAVGVNGRANYPDGSFPMAFADVTPELGDGITFAVATWPCEYFHDMAP